MVKVSLKNHKQNGDIELASVYFNPTTKPVINFKYDPDKSFQEVLYRIDNWINEGSGWVIQSVDVEYVNISVYSPLSGSTFIKLSCTLIDSMKGLINSKNNDSKCFLWCHIIHLNPLKTHPERIAKADKKMANDLDYEDVEFPVSKKYFSKIEKKNNIFINAFCYESGLVYPVSVSDQEFKNCMDLLLIGDGNKSHYVYIHDLCAIKQSVKIKNTFADIVYNILVLKKFW